MTQHAEPIAAEARGAVFTADAPASRRAGARLRRDHRTASAIRCCAACAAAAPSSGLSGGIDSSVTRGAVRARRSGPTTCSAVLMPEKDSDPDSLRLGRLVAETYGIRHVVEDIAPTLAAAGCYLRRDDAIRQLVPGLRRRLELQGGALQRAAGGSATA